VSQRSRIMTLVRCDLPTGDVTFFFTDVEGSKLLHELRAERYAEARTRLADEAAPLVAAVERKAA
jgi:hypothetical protein